MKPPYHGCDLEIVGLKCPKYEWNYANKYAIGSIKQAFKVGAKIITKGPYRGVGDDRCKYPKSIVEVEDQAVFFIGFCTLKVRF